jgi:hypothetical protein
MGCSTVVGSSNPIVAVRVRSQKQVGLVGPCIVPAARMEPAVSTAKPGGEVAREEPTGAERAVGIGKLS